jgi:hypothetical protein
MSETTISISAGSLSRAADRLLRIAQLVPTPEGMSPEIYINLRAKTSESSKAMLTIQRFGVQVKVNVGMCVVNSPLQEVCLPIPASFMKNINGRGEDLLVLTQSQQDAGTLKYKRGMLVGTVALNDPSSMFEAVVTGAPTALIELPIRALKGALAVTQFASPDPRVTATGPISQIKSSGGHKLMVVTYDSLSGALFQAETEENFPVFDLTIPNRVMSAIIEQTNEDKASIGFNERCLVFRAKDISVIFPMGDYPVINVADRIRDIVNTAQLGFRVQPGDLIATVESVTNLAHMDKEIISAELVYDTGRLLVRVNSQKLSGKNMIKVTPLFNERFTVLVDSRRLIGFLKSTKQQDQIDVLYNQSRIIVKTQNVTFAFAGS